MAGKGYAYLYEMGLGKTLSTIATAGALWQEGEIETMLVAAPTSVCAVWEKDFAEFAGFDYELIIMLGSKGQRLKALERLEESHNKGLKVAVINYESTWRDGIYQALYAWMPDLIVCDESQRIKNHTANQSIAMRDLGDNAKYRLILSGTPIQNNAIDLFSQYRFLDPTVFGRNYYAFRARYAIMGGFNKKQIVGYKDLDELIKKEHSIAYRVTKAEALDLPEQVFTQRIVKFDAKTRAMYDRLRRSSFMELENGGQVTATTVLTRILRLQQFTGGFVQPDDADRPQAVHTAKLDALKDIVEDYVIGDGKKLVIFCRFRAEITAITGMLDKLKVKHADIHGDVPQKERGDIVEDFQKNPETMAAVLQLQTAGLGITLTAADTCVYYSLDYNYANYSQSLARIHRIGQQNKCTYIHLIADKTVDEMVLQALAKKEDLAKTIVDTWRQYFT